MSDVAVGPVRVEAVIRPQTAEQVCAELLAADLLDELHAQEVLGSGRRADGPADDPMIDTLPKVLIAGYCDDEDLPAVLDLLLTHARCGRVGDGKIWIQRPVASTG